MQDEVSYLCESCGEEIVIPFDISEGTTQYFTEDCPVCCRPNAIAVEFRNGIMTINAETEQF